MRSRAPVAGRRGAATVDIGAAYAALPLVVDEPEPCGAVLPELELEPEVELLEPPAEPLEPEAEPLEPEAESLEPAPVLGAGAPVGGVPPGAVPWGGVAPCGGGPPDGRRACIAARTFVADRPSCFAS